MFKDFYMQIAPEYCGVHLSYGTIADLVFQAESNGEEAFAADKFENIRERAKMGFPYEAYALPGTYENVINFAEYVMTLHAQESHGEDYDERIGLLSETLNKTNPEWMEDPQTEGLWSN